MSDLKNVVILGLGAAGISSVQSLSKSLPATHRLVVVQEFEFSFFPIASLRAQTVPGWEKKVAAPISQLFSAKSRHVLLAGTKVVSFKDHSIVVDKANGAHIVPQALVLLLKIQLSTEKKGFSTEIPFEYAVIATVRRFKYTSGLS